MLRAAFVQPPSAAGVIGPGRFAGCREACAGCGRVAGVSREAPAGGVGRHPDTVRFSDAGLPDPARSPRRLRCYALPGRGRCALRSVFSSVCGASVRRHLFAAGVRCAVRGVSSAMRAAGRNNRPFAGNKVGNNALNDYFCELSGVISRRRTQSRIRTDRL